jgi:hypothetical protein
MDAMIAGSIFPPIRICADTGRIIDGFHRFVAHERLNRKTISCVGEAVSNEAEFFLKSVGANKSHGLGYSHADQAKIVKIAAVLKLDRIKVAFAMSIPIQKIEKLARYVPPTNQGHHGVHSLESRYGAAKDPDSGKTSDRIATEGYLFHFNQVIKFFKSGLYDPKSRNFTEKMREIKALIGEAEKALTAPEAGRGDRDAA